MPTSRLDSTLSTQNLTAQALQHTVQTSTTQPAHALPAKHHVAKTHTSTGDTFESGTTHHTGTPVSGATSATRERLATAARHAALSMGGYHGHGRCAAGVERAVSSALHIQVSGNGNSIGRSLLHHGFHEVHMSLKDALKQPGLVLTWQHTPTKLGRKYGHTAVTLGDGHSSASDFVERNTVAGSAGRTGLHIYAPNR